MMEPMTASQGIERPAAPRRTGKHVCPWWAGYLLASPLRRLFENPEVLLAPHVRDGMTAIDFGCAMGFLSLPIARRVGARGRVVCVDLQERMLRVLRRRARRRGLEAIVETRACTNDDPSIADLRGKADIALAFHVVHETPAPERVVRELASVLRPGGRLLLAEPVGHVSRDDLEFIFGLPQAAGLVCLGERVRRRSRFAVFEKPE